MGRGRDPPTGVLWMLLCLQRGALQGLREYQPVGVSIVAEGFLRLVFSLVLVAVGLGVTGALLGTPVSFVVVGIWLERELHRRVGPSAPGTGGCAPCARWSATDGSRSWASSCSPPCRTST